jgi:hypothetical protein
MNEWPDRAQKQIPDHDAYRHLIERLPVTLRPSLNQQLNQWETLFPFEQNRLANFMEGVETFSPSALDALMAPLWTLEKKMGVSHWNFSETSDTIENASQLGRSAYYAEWRREVQRGFDAVNTAARDSTPIQTAFTRLILLFLPGNLPVDPQSAWKEWDTRGHAIRISGDSEKLCELVMQGQPSLSGIATLAARQGSGYNLSIQDGVIVRQRALLDDRSEIRLGQGAVIGNYARIYTHTHEKDDYDKVIFAKTDIGARARVGAHTVVLAGTQLGEGAIVGPQGTADDQEKDHGQG